MRLNRLIRLAVGAAAIPTLCAFAPGAPYTIDFPKGWGEPVVEKTIATVKAPASVGNAACNAQSNDLPGLVGLTQAEINAEFGKPMDAAGWANFVGVDAAKLTVSDTELRPAGAGFFLIGTLHLMPGAVDPNETTVRMGVYILPGRVVLAGCYARPADYPRMKDLFEATVSSLKPQ